MEIVEAFRKAMVDVLVPEIREVKGEVGELRKEMNDRFAKMDERFAKNDERWANLMADMRELRAATNLLLSKVDVADRVVRLEVRVDHLEKHRP